MRTSDFKPGARLRALFVGLYDTGKDWAAASYPGPQYHLDFDGRIASLILFKDIEYISFQGTKGFVDLNKVLDTLVSQASNPTSFPYKTVVASSMTNVGRFFLSDYNRISGGAGKGKKLGSLQVPTLESYLYENEATWQFIYEHLLVLPCNVILTAHKTPKYRKVKIDGVEETIEDGEQLCLRDKLRAQLPTMFPEIYEFSKEFDPRTQTVRRFVQFDGELARTSYPILARTRRVEITDKNFYELWSGLINSQEERKES